MTEKFTEIDSWDDVPDFEDEDEEAAYWATHGPSEKLLATFQAVPEEGDEELPPARSYPGSRRASIPLDDDLMRRLRRLAQQRGKGYQTLMKEFVVERLYEEERREGKQLRDSGSS